MSVHKYDLFRQKANNGCQDLAKPESRTKLILYCDRNVHLEFGPNDDERTRAIVNLEHLKHPFPPRFAPSHADRSRR
jgi:hypothetical protein